MKREQDYQQVDPKTLVQHPANPRRGDVDAIAESVKANGFYGALIVQSSTRRVLAGNHRLEAALRLGLDTVPVLEVDCTDQEALAILLADNRTNDLAEYDRDALANLLSEMNDTIGLLGTGYDEDDLSDMLRVVESTSATPLDPYDEWEGMPEYEQQDRQSTFRVTIHFRTSDDADAFFTLINRTRKSSLWWPVDDDHVGSTVKQHYVAES